MKKIYHKGSGRSKKSFEDWQWTFEGSYFRWITCRKFRLCSDVGTFWKENLPRKLERSTTPAVVKVTQKCR